MALRPQTILLPIVALSHLCNSFSYLFSILIFFAFILNQWFPTLFDAFLPLLTLELFIPPLIFRVRRLVLTTLGTIVLIDDNNLFNKVGQKLFVVK